MKEFELKKIIAGRGFYCKINYEIELIDFKYGKTDFDIYNKWHNSVAFASDYFFDKYSIYKDRGFKLQIQGIHDMIIDTTPVVVVYSIIMLLAKETGYIITDFTINENGNLIFPK